MPFYISSCLFTSYVLYVCLRGSHMCHMTACVLCFYACVSSPHSANYPMHHCSFHFLIIRANKFNHLATYKYYIYISMNVIIFFCRSFSLNEIHTHSTLMSAVGSFVLSLVCWPNECNIATIISFSLSTHTHGHMACDECFKYVFCWLCQPVSRASSISF